MGSSKQNPSRRFKVRFGDEEPKPSVVSVPQSSSELLDRAMRLLEELRNADFLPEEFHGEYRALRTAWEKT